MIEFKQPKTTLNKSYSILHFYLFIVATKLTSNWSETPLSHFLTVDRNTCKYIILITFRHKIYANNRSHTHKQPNTLSHFLLQHTHHSVNCLPPGVITCRPIFRAFINSEMNFQSVVKESTMTMKMSLDD